MVREQVTPDSQALVPLGFVKFNKLDIQILLGGSR